MCGSISLPARVGLCGGVKSVVQVLAPVCARLCTGLCDFEA